MARALLGFAPRPNDHLRDVEIARLRARVREQQQELVRLQSEVRALRADAEARVEVDRELSDAQLDEMTLDRMAVSPV